MISKHINFLTSLFLTTAIVLISTQNAGSQNPQKLKPKGLIIKQVIKDIVDGEFYIHGINFDNGLSPSVTLGDIELMVKSYTTVNIIAALPPSLLDGGYRFLSQGPRGTNVQMLTT